WRRTASSAAPIGGQSLHQLGLEISLTPRIQKGYCKTTGGSVSGVADHGDSLRNPLFPCVLRTNWSLQGPNRVKPARSRSKENSSENPPILPCVNLELKT